MKVCLIVLVLLLHSAQLLAQNPFEYRGKMIGLAPDRAHIYQRVFEQLTSAAKVPTVFSPPLGKEVRLAAGDLIDDRSANGTKLKVLILEPLGKSPQLAADLDADGTITAEERFPLISAGEGGAYRYSPPCGRNQ